MEKHCSALCALALTLGAFAHFDLVCAADADGSVKGKLFWILTSCMPNLRSSEFGVGWGGGACLSVSFTFINVSFLPHCLFVSGIPPKPGHCPRLLNVVPSHKGCVCDEDCPADHKCCVYDCGAVCVPPALCTSHSVELSGQLLHLSLSHL